MNANTELRRIAAAIALVAAVFATGACDYTGGNPAQRHHCETVGEFCN